MYGPPGTGKTLLARACAAQTDATFLKLAGPQLVQMFIGDGAKLVRDCFALAKEKAPAIIFIDELDAVGTKRFDSEKSGDREVQRTMLELLNQLDGFASDDRIKVIAATNRVDVLDPALLRSGRLDRKIEFPLPNEEARAQILKIHSRKMKVDPAVNWGELARSTDEFGGAMLKAVCVEAGMIALRMGKNKIGHEHYVDAIAEVQAKKKDVSISFCAQQHDSCGTDHPPRRSTSMLKHHVAGRVTSKDSISTSNVVHRNWYASLIERAVCVISRAMSGCPFIHFLCPFRSLVLLSISSHPPLPPR
jgi:ATP-dependent 26S proteasome regulatory subunit